jgi:hypothetical protein
MTTLKIENTDSRHNRMTCKIYKYSKLPVIWYPSIQTSHPTSKNSKKIYRFHKDIEQNCAAHMFTHHVTALQLPSAEAS